MAKLYEFSEEQQQLWDTWVAERPEMIQQLCERFQPNRLYLHTVTGQKVIPEAFDEDGTMRILIPRRLNIPFLPTKSVFGVDPLNIVESDLPDGVNLMSFEEFQAFIE